MDGPSRNQPCPCGSGSRFKHCHGRIDPAPAPFVPDEAFWEEVDQIARRKAAERAQSQAQQGLGRGIVSAEAGGSRVVCVGNEVHFSPHWRTFHDFLDFFLIEKLGRDWFSVEMAKPPGARHRVAEWWQAAHDHIKRNGRPGRRGVLLGTMIGVQRAYLNLAYNIYLIAHHAPVEGRDKLLETFLRRLRSDRRDDFFGKLFETYAAAAFLKAGFLIEYEDEQAGGQSHVEFVATYPGTGRRFSVEVKTRAGAPTDQSDGGNAKLRVASKLRRALQKDAVHLRVVMIEVNVPCSSPELSLDGWPRAALEEIRAAENEKQDTVPLDPAYVLVTNHTFHSDLLSAGAPVQAMAAGFKIPDFGAGSPFRSLGELLRSKERHVEMYALIESMRSHYDIPSTFDGENPEVAFGSSRAPRLRIGDWYEVPLDDGTSAPGRLHDVAVMEGDRSAITIHEVPGRGYVVNRLPLEEGELAAWRKHPETYFGEVRPATKRAGSWLELAMEYYETYRHTPRLELLKFMEGWPDFERLSRMPDAELAEVYCERLAHSVFAAMAPARNR